MNDELKEILDNLEDAGFMYKRISPEEIKKILDYITNLQQENERLKEIVENLTTMTVCDDNKQIKNTAQYKLDIYKSRIDKAIEYIEENDFTNDMNFMETGIGNLFQVILNFLKGDSDE